MEEWIGRVAKDQGVLDWDMKRLRWSRPDKQTVCQEQANPYVKETKAFIHALRTVIAPGFCLVMRMLSRRRSYLRRVEVGSFPQAGPHRRLVQDKSHH
ncbi:hypothetical protein [Paenibacillus sp.]|jgi:hypothetical protein|uniref:hypothetical protein n=1 Tax=Paenibacillus sp. TaxID=58172 RepID=UPI0028266938|nr:hypothetical protein [Paenibacillus sp.]MDR0267085.1 hypothetical protein [Paenibacillus sp.]